MIEEAVFNLRTPPQFSTQYASYTCQSSHESAAAPTLILTGWPLAFIVEDAYPRTLGPAVFIMIHTLLRAVSFANTCRVRLVQDTGDQRPTAVKTDTPVALTPLRAVDTLLAYMKPEFHTTCWLGQCTQEWQAQTGR